MFLVPRLPASWERGLLNEDRPAGRTGDHEPEDCEHRGEGGKSKGKPPPEEPVVPDRQPGSLHRRLSRQIAQADLHPNHRQPEGPGEKIKNNRPKNPKISESVANMPRQRHTGDR